MVEVETTDAYDAWYLDLDKREAAAVDRKVKALQIMGLALPFPHSSDIRGGKYAFRELRVNVSVIRVIYAFDPERKAVLIIGADKTGDERFYERIIPQAEKIWTEYLSRLPSAAPAGPGARR